MKNYAIGFAIVYWVSTLLSLFAGGLIIFVGNYLIAAGASFFVMESFVAKEKRFPSPREVKVLILAGLLAIWGVMLFLGCALFIYSSVAEHHPVGSSFLSTQFVLTCLALILVALGLGHYIVIRWAMSPYMDSGGKENAAP